MSGKIKRYLLRDGEMIRKAGHMPLARLMLESQTPFWILDRYRGLIPEMFKDIIYDRHTQCYMTEKPIEEEKTVDPNSLDTVLER